MEATQQYKIFRESSSSFRKYIFKSDVALLNFVKETSEIIINNRGSIPKDNTLDKISEGVYHWNENDATCLCSLQNEIISQIPLVLLMKRDYKKILKDYHKQIFEKIKKTKMNEYFEMELHPDFSIKFLKLGDEKTKNYVWVSETFDYNLIDNARELKNYYTTYFT